MGLDTVSETGGDQFDHLRALLLPLAFLFFSTIFTCKLLVTVSPAAKLGDELASELEDEDCTCLVVNYDHMTVQIHSYALWPHEPPRAKFRLRKERT